MDPVDVLRLILEGIGAVALSLGMMLVNGVRRDVLGLQKDVKAIEVLVAGKYVTRDELRAEMDRFAENIGLHVAAALNGQTQQHQHTHSVGT